MIAVFAAMDAEVDACVASLGPTRRRTLADFTVVEGDIATVCKTGIGRRAEEVSRTLVSSLSPDAVLSVGTAGGLSHDLEAGEIVLCERLDLEPQGDHSRQEEAVWGDVRLLTAAQRAAERCGVSVRAGRSVTVDGVAWGPEEKARLRDWMGHDIVEMESFWIGRVAGEHGVPFLAVRAVSDRAGDRLPEIPGLVSDDGSVDFSRVLPYVSEHPEIGPLLASQAERSRRAMESLRGFLAAFLPLASSSISQQRPHLSWM